jgi:thymidylate kinase
MPIELISRLIQDFNTEKIGYCHWKSNYYLAESLSGKLDLDLFVDRRSLPRAFEILAKLGFKPAVALSGVSTPGIYHYFGFDARSGQLVHVHLFNRILTGESFVKTHLFPFENMLLDDVYDIENIKVPSRPAELVLFVLRTFIKYGSLLDLVYLLGKEKELSAELRWLLAGHDISESLVLLEKYCPVIDANLFTRAIDLLGRKSSLTERIALAFEVRDRLRGYAKYNGLGLASAYLDIVLEQVDRRMAGVKKNRTLSAGGAVIAFIGAEATGKSTLVSETNKWLGEVFPTRTIHAGKPPATWFTAPINVILPLARRLWPQLRTSRMEGHVSMQDQVQSPPKTTGLSGLIFALRSVSLAWDRKRLLVKARRMAAENKFVICDRYPSETIGVMDSPRLEENPNAKGALGALFNRLARVEKQLYREIPPPDIVLKLKVSVETAKQRNRDRIKVGKETDEYLESRHRQSGEWYMAGAKYIHIIDTEQSLDETILSAKRAVWESL